MLTYDVTSQPRNLFQNEFSNDNIYEIFNNN